MRRHRLAKLVKGLGFGLLGLLVLFVIVYAVLPKGPRESMPFNDPHQVDRPLATASQYMAATGNQWATAAALEVMHNGGNAVDAAVASLLVLNVTFGEAASFPGVAPVLVYDAKTATVEGYIGAGKAPAKATIDLFKSRGWDNVPEMDIWAQLLPASPDVIIALLEKYGTQSFSQLSAPAIRIARAGYPVHDTMLKDLNLSLIERAGFTFLMPYNSQVYMSGQWWRPLHHGERTLRLDLANTFEALSNAEQAAVATGATRIEALQAVRDTFYKGDIAQKIVAFHAQKNGLFTAQDLANYQGAWEKPLSGQFGDYTIYANDTWSQGGVVPMVLQMLDGIDLKSMGHNSPEYIHTVLQAIELAMADREAYFGDPQFVQVPIQGLLDPRYAQERRKLMTPGKAFTSMPPAGDPAHLGARLPGWQPVTLNTHTGGTSLDFNVGKDTSYISIVDAQGNAVSMTPSDFPKTPMVPGTGLTLGNRMTQFYLDAQHADGLQPGKRPRITPNPSMVFKDGKFLMALGTPGGDTQTQTIVQVFLNMVVFGMDSQAAINAPRFQSFNFPDSFAPHESQPGTIGLEKSLYAAAGKQLEAMGYKVQVGGDWDNLYGAADVIRRDPLTGQLSAGADPREESWAAGN
jgi:gamma-glutamyltranspeptidase / glutathione hydrolase